MSKAEIIFTDLDLDGCCSYLAYCWLTQTKPKAITIKVSSLREKFLAWLKRNKISDYKNVYFFDLDTTEIKDLIDKKNVTIFDHHKSHEEKYKNNWGLSAFRASEVVTWLIEEKKRINISRKKII